MRGSSSLHFLHRLVEGSPAMSLKTQLQFLQPVEFVSQIGLEFLVLLPLAIVFEGNSLLRVQIVVVVDEVSSHQSPLVEVEVEKLEKKLDHLVVKLRELQRIHDRYVLTHQIAEDFEIDEGRLHVFLEEFGENQETLLLSLLFLVEALLLQHIHLRFERDEFAAGNELGHSCVVDEFVQDFPLLLLMGSQYEVEEEETSLFVFLNRLPKQSHPEIVPAFNLISENALQKLDL